EGREVPACAGRDPSAQRRVLERLREVPQGEAVLAQLLFEDRARGSRLNPRGLGDRVDLEDAIHALQVDADDTGVLLAHPWLDPADHAGAAAVGNRGGLLVGA